jgi:hypothetical protein
MWKRGRVKMTIEWLAGNRLRGTTAERPNSSLPSAGGWVELGRTTLSSQGDTISVSSLPDKRYYMILGDTRPTGSAVAEVNLNGDNGSNYSETYSLNGASDTQAPNEDRMASMYNSSGVNRRFHVGYISSKSGKEKIGIFHTNENPLAGANYIPNRKDNAGKWNNTSDAIHTISIDNDFSGDLYNESQLVVLGWDPTDTHTTNFWEELASVNASGSSTILDSGTFTAKNYLMVQIYLEAASDLTTQLVTYNNDASALYSQTSVRNGTAVDNASINHANLNVTGGTNQKAIFYSGFILNKSTTEKLAIFSAVGQNTAGASAAPVRLQQVHKYATNTQITSIKISQDNSVNFGTNSIIKVWGAD